MHQYKFQDSKRHSDAEPCCVTKECYPINYKYENKFSEIGHIKNCALNPLMENVVKKYFLSFIYVFGKL